MDGLLKPFEMLADDLPLSLSIRNEWPRARFRCMASRLWGRKEARPTQFAGSLMPLTMGGPRRCDPVKERQTAFPRTCCRGKRDKRGNKGTRRKRTPMSSWREHGGLLCSAESHPSRWCLEVRASFGSQAVRTCPDPWLCVPTSRWVCLYREGASPQKYCLRSERYAY